jgi:multimeric flavodoxin WrbA
MMVDNYLFNLLTEELNKDIKLKENVDKTIDYLKDKKDILFLVTSNRGKWLKDEQGEKAKSTMLAEYIAKKIKSDVQIIDVSELKIYSCEGNVSISDGNKCGVKDAILKNTKKNPSKNHRCWASFNNSDDELWKISKVLLESKYVVFFGSVRWGQMNSTYQKLIERLTWLENRHTTLGEDNIIKDIECGIITTGHNWNGDNVIKTQKQVLNFFGFKVSDNLCWSHQYLKDANDETNKNYLNDFKDFKKIIKS